jgi:hypothetical protein
MERRQFDVIDIVEVLQHWHAGRPKSVVASSLGIDAKTVRKCVAPAEAACLVPGRADPRPSGVGGAGAGLVPRAGRRPGPQPGVAGHRRPPGAHRRDDGDQHRDQRPPAPCATSTPGGGHHRVSPLRGVGVSRRRQRAGRHRAAPGGGPGRGGPDRLRLPGHHGSTRSRSGRGGCGRSSWCWRAAATCSCGRCCPWTPARGRPRAVGHHRHRRPVPVLCVRPPSLGPPPVRDARRRPCAPKGWRTGLLTDNGKVAQRSLGVGLSPSEQDGALVVDATSSGRHRARRGATLATLRRGTRKGCTRPHE